MTAEIWKPIPGFEGEFDVSDKGRVRRLYAGGEDGWRIMKLSRHGSCGTYLVVNLSRIGARATGKRHAKGSYRPGAARYAKVHVLVLEAHVGPRPAGMQGLHWDDDGFNNRLSNLRWGTSAENGEDMKRNGKRRGEGNGRSKLTAAQVAEIRAAWAEDDSRGRKAALGAQYGVTAQTIRGIVDGLIWREAA